MGPIGSEKGKLVKANRVASLVKMAKIYIRSRAESFVGAADCDLESGAPVFDAVEAAADAAAVAAVAGTAAAAAATSAAWRRSSSRSHVRAPVSSDSDLPCVRTKEREWRFPTADLCSWTGAVGRAEQQTQDHNKKEKS